MLKRHAIGQYYQQLMERTPDELERWKKKWGSILGVEDVRIEESIELANKVLMTGRARSQHFMALFDLYFTPSKLARWGIGGGDKCNRCGLFAANS